MCKTKIEILNKVFAEVVPHTICFDFDGVFTDNKVWVDSESNELVRCDRSDGLGISVLLNYCLKSNMNLNFLVLSTEHNKVVSARSKKLGLTCFQGVADKKSFLSNYLEKTLEIETFTHEGLIYIGNDINDFEVMQLAGLKVAPNDAHPSIRDISDIVLDTNGGEGCVREFVELLFLCNLFKTDMLSAYLTLRSNLR